MSDVPKPPSYSEAPLDALLGAVDKGYVGVHIEQGVPVLDRDLNLLGDLLLNTMRTVVERYIGSGVAAGSDAFAISEAADDNDFVILAGAEPPGRCLVGGIEVRIDEPLRYRAQDGDDLDELTTPTGDQPDPREDTVYLDVWLVEEAGADDQALLNPHDVGLRTSTRTKPAWRVRVAEGQAPPKAQAGHVHYPLARLRRPRGQARIEAGHITDLRRTHLNLAGLEGRVGVLEQLPERLLEDLFGVAPGEYQEGKGRPTISVREVLNALLRNELPGTPPQVVAPLETEEGYHDAGLERDGTITMAWPRMLPDEDDEMAVVVGRVRADGTPEPPQQITPGASTTAGPTPFDSVNVVPLSSDRVLVAYFRPFGGGSGERRVSFKLAAYEELAAAEEHHIEALDFRQMNGLRAVATGGLLTFVSSVGNSVAYMRLRWDEDPGEWWMDDGPQALGDTIWMLQPTAVPDADGRIWVAHEEPKPGGGTEVQLRIRVLRLDPESAAIDGEATRDAAGSLRGPLLHYTRDGVPWLFWRNQDEELLYCAFFDGSDWQDQGPLPVEQSRGHKFAAADSADGSVWVFGAHWLDGEPAKSRLWACRRDPASGFWSEPRLASPSTGPSYSPVVVSHEGGRMTLLYLRKPDFDSDLRGLYHREIVTVF